MRIITMRRGTGSQEVELLPSPREPSPPADLTPEGATVAGTVPDTGVHQPDVASHGTNPVHARIRAVVAQVAGAAVDVAGAWSSLRRQTRAARAVAEAALAGARAGCRAVAAAAAVAARAVETTTTWPISTAGATAARRAGATLDEQVAGA